MSRRCRPGIRARIISTGRNDGAVVVVVRRYFGELVSGAHWPKPMLVVTSLGGPLATFAVHTKVACPPSMTIVVDDSELEPLRDDDDSLGIGEGLGKDQDAPGEASRETCNG